jgi:hypothetical protein
MNSCKRLVIAGRKEGGISLKENRTSLQTIAYHGVMFTSISALSDLLASKQGFFKQISVAWLESDLENLQQ